MHAGARVAILSTKLPYHGTGSAFEGTKGDVRTRKFGWAIYAVFTLIAFRKRMLLLD
jgi:hypothetical protein